MGLEFWAKKIASVQSKGKSMYTGPLLMPTDTVPVATIDARIVSYATARGNSCDWCGF